MADPRFTEGPWSLAPGRSIVARKDAKLAQVCRVTSTDVGHATADANASLIRSAPKLYAALGDVLEDLHVYEFKTGKGRDVVSEAHFNAARDALARARGEAV